MNTAAQAVDKQATGEEAASQYLTFMLAGEEYGVDIHKVQEIRCWEQPTMLPNAINFVLGVINLRGTVVPIIDLRRRFGLEHGEFGPTTVVVVAKVSCADKDRVVGVVVDAVSEVYNVNDEQVRPAPDLGGAISTDFVKGLVTLGEKMIILLDIDKLINAGLFKELDKQE
ncbi:MAG TPA: chemotaxis protein CheW [Gammaproteobacteria bacterium]|nr:chemotaxis protein CheW [Gammaproteobacteria bacterium]